MSIWDDYFKHSVGFLIDKGWGAGASCPGRFILPSAQRMDNLQILLHQGIFSWKGYKPYFSQSSMLTSNVPLGYVLTRGGGQAVQDGLSCPPVNISERIDNTQILLHHLLQEYLVERDINFISVNLRCLLQSFNWVMYSQGVGGKLSRAVYLAPPQTPTPTPPPRISERMDNPQNVLHHLLQEYLGERGINFISVNLRCLLQTFSWDTYFFFFFFFQVCGFLFCKPLLYFTLIAQGKLSGY